ncbi:MAG: leucine-rich repeat protein, partial [Clostridia bacterium]
KKIIKVAHAQAVSNNIVPNIIGDIKAHIKYLQTNKYNVNIVNTFGDMQLVKSTMTKALTNNLTPYEKKIVLFRSLLIAGAILLGTIATVACLLIHSGILIFNMSAFLAASCTIAIVSGIAVGIVLFNSSVSFRLDLTFAVVTIGVLLMLEFLFGYLIEVGFWGGLVVLAILIVIAIVLSWTVVGKKHIANKTQSSERRSNKKNIKITIAITAVLTLIAMVGNGVGVGLASKGNDRQFTVRNGVLVGFNADMNKGKVLVIPSVDAVTGKEIHTIGKNAFAKQGFFVPKQLEAEKIVISEGIRRIEDGAFSYKKTNKNLISIKTPNSLQYIGDDAFSEQSNLVIFNFGDNLGHIGKKAFYSTGIKKFDYCGNANLEIADYAFGGTKMASIFISKNITNIGVGAFGNNSVLCTQCTSYSELLRKFEDKEYLKNSYLKIKYNVDNYGKDGNYDYTIKNGKATITGFNKFEFAEHEIVKIPDVLGGYKVANIAEGVFKNNLFMFAVILPTYLEGIGSEAFANCNNLVAVWIGANVKTIGKGAFS